MNDQNQEPAREYWRLWIDGVDHGWATPELTFELLRMEFNADSEGIFYNLIIEKRQMTDFELDDANEQVEVP